MSKIRGAIVVDMDRCKGCALCVEACPQNVIAMARKVKCQITKEWGMSDAFYKAPNGKYYKSKKL